MKKIILVSILLLSISACTTPILRTTKFPNSIFTPTSDSVPPSSSSTAPARIGVPYYLPRALIPITITLAKSTPPADNKSTPTADTPTSSTAVSQKIGQYEVTIGAPLLIPDTSRPPFFLEYNAEGATEDEITIGVGANQLLQTMKATSIDKSGEAIVKLAEIGIRAAELFGLRAGGDSCTELEPVKVFAYLDPSSTRNDTSPFSLSALNDLLKLNYVPMEFNVVPQREKEKIAVKESGSSEPPNDELGEIISENRTTGILFRTSEPYVLTLSFGPNIHKKAGSWCVIPEIHQTMVMAPNKGKMYAVDVNRGALITKKTDLTIVDGMLTKIEVTKPSSLVGVISIPLDILKLALSVPAELLTLRVKRIQDERDITQAQAEKLTYELNKYNNNKLLQDAIKPPVTPGK